MTKEARWNSLSRMTASESKKIKESWLTIKYLIEIYFFTSKVSKFLTSPSSAITSLTCDRGEPT